MGGWRGCGGVEGVVVSVVVWWCNECGWCGGLVGWLVHI